MSPGIYSDHFRKFYHESLGTLSPKLQLIFCLQDFFTLLYGVVTFVGPDHFQCFVKSVKHTSVSQVVLSSSDQVVYVLANHLSHPPFC